MREKVLFDNVLKKIPNKINQIPKKKVKIRQKKKNNRFAI